MHCLYTCVHRGNIRCNEGAWSENKILVITFDENQLVKKYKILTEDDSSEINISYPKKAYNQNSEVSLIQDICPKCKSNKLDFVSLPCQNCIYSLKKETLKSL